MQQSEKHEKEAIRKARTDRATRRGMARNRIRLHSEVTTVNGTDDRKDLRQYMGNNRQVNEVRILHTLYRGIDSERSGLRFHQSCHSKPWSTENGYFRQRNDNELQILEDAYSKARYTMEAIDGIPSPDRWTDGAIESDTGTVLTMPR